MNSMDTELDFIDCQSIEKIVKKQVVTGVINFTKRKEMGL